MEQYSNNLTDPMGNAVPRAKVTINKSDGSLATLFSDKAGEHQIDNPITCDDLGRFSFFAANGSYSGTVAGSSIAPVDLPAFSLYDPDDDPYHIANLTSATGTTRVGGTWFGNVVATVAQLATSLGASLVGFIQDAVGAIVRSIQDKLREQKSLLDFASDSLKAAVASGTYGTQDYADLLTALNAAAASMLAKKHNLLLPAGFYPLNGYSFPFRQSGAVTSLLDFNNVTVFGEGPATVLATTSSTGADVLQLNGVKNLHFRNFSVQATLTATSGAGSNGISITGGYDNVTFQGVSVKNCQGIDKGDHIDGGKGFSVQCDAATQEVGRLRISGCFVTGCSQGFGFESDLVNFLTKKTAIDVDLIAEDCFVHSSIGAPAATGAIPSGTHTGIRVRGQAINCQKAVMLGRAHGVQVDVQVVTTKTAAARRLDPRGVPWYAADTVVEALYCAYAKNSQVRITGNVGACDYKARIGGASAGSSGLSGATEYCNFFIDLSGTAATSNLAVVNSGGNVMNNCALEVTPTTTATLPSEFYLTSSTNRLAIGPAAYLPGPQLAGRTKFMGTSSGTFNFAAIDLFGSIAAIQGLTASSAGVAVLGLYDFNSAPALMVKNGGRLWLPTTVPTYADNATAVAAGMATGDVYRTSTGVLMVTY